LTGLRLSGFRIRRERWPIYTRLVDERQPVFVADSFALAAALLPGFARPLVNRTLQLSGVTEQTHAIYVPLMAKNQVIGVLGIWGEGLLEEDIPAATVFAGQVLVTRQPIVLERYGDVPRPTQPGLLEHAVIGMPIFWQGDLIGFFGLGSPPPRRFTVQDVRLLELFVRHTAIAIANARLFDAEKSARAQAEAQAAELTRSNTLLTSLGHVATKLTSATNPEEVMVTLGRELKQLGVYCVVALLEQETRDLKIDFTSLEMPALQLAEKLTGLRLSGFRIRRERWPIYTRLVDERQPVFVADSFALAAALLPGLARSLMNRTLQLSGVTEQTHAVYVPLMVKSQVIGVLGMWGEGLLEEDIPAATVFAGQVAAAIENRQQQALLYERAQQLAILEERRRLARDLHDSVTQLIFSVTLIAQSISPAWRRDPAEGEKRVDRLLELSKRALVEMRALLAELQLAQEDNALRAEALPAALARHISGLTQDGLQIHLQASRYVPQPPALEECLFRIAQEALNNVIKHAHASRVNVILRCEDKEVCLKVRDNGIGFQVDPIGGRRDSSSPRFDDSANHDGFGILNMRERAASRGGSLRVISKPRKGTTVEVRIPITRQV
ncbi:MAG TPA: GAF domain-containing protein, partial [Nitrospiraceae bacterium]|nr:GAF domain-containing protein [Nitrospiraceae bacterium]